MDEILSPTWKVLIDLTDMTWSCRGGDVRLIDW